MVILPRLFLMAMLTAGLSHGLTEEQQKTIEKLENTLLAPCCYSEALSKHRSEIALEMKAEIAKMVAAGTSEQEILELYKGRYGLRVLREPEGARWWWLQVVPMVVAALGLVFVILVLRRWLRPAPEPSP